MSMAIKAAKFQGDPGLFGFLGRAAKKIGGALIPSPIRSVGETILGAVRPRPSAPSFTVPPGRSMARGFAAPPPRVPQVTAQPVVRTPGIRGAAQRLLPGGATGFEVQPSAVTAAATPGFHINKSSYFLQSGEFVPAGSRLVRNRRRNPGNMRAADRAISRIESAKRMAKRLGRITVRARGCKACR